MSDELIGTDRLAPAGSPQQSTQTAIINLDAVDLADLVRLAPRGRSAWRWIEDEGARIKSPVVVIENGAIVSATAEGGLPPDRIARAVLGALRRRSARRSESAKKAAVTRDKRKQALVYQVVQRLLDGGSLRASSACVLCGKGVSDEASRARGIGSDCWQGVLSVLQQERERQEAAQ